jgi:hypothetical protein
MDSTTAHPAPSSCSSTIVIEGRLRRIVESTAFIIITAILAFWSFVLQDILYSATTTKEQISPSKALTVIFHLPARADGYVLLQEDYMWFPD